MRTACLQLPCGAEADAELVADLRSALRAAAEPERALQMQRYMKSAMPYLGVRVPIGRRLARAAEDEVAHRVADLRADFPAEMDPVLREWSTDGDMWLRRAAIISQLGARQATDLDLLTGVISPTWRTGSSSSARPSDGR
jgi:3-methyladenine DNA glycosylase AlkD